MMTPEIDLYVEGDDSEMFSDLIDATIGQGSVFHRTFHYYGDGVSPRTAIMPQDWRSRAVTYKTADDTVQALCPSADDIAVAKLCAWRVDGSEYATVGICRTAQKKMATRKPPS
jgi:hypothetical protein